MGDLGTHDPKTLDCPQSDQIVPNEETLLCDEDPGGLSNLEDALIEGFLDEPSQELARIEIKNADEKTLGKTPPLDDGEALLFQTLEEPQRDELQDVLMESLLDSIGDDGVEDQPSLLDTSRPRLDSGNDRLIGSGEPSGKDANPSFSVSGAEFSPFFSQRWIEDEICPVGAGLANLGNTCFLNAILQCFTHTVPLIQGLLSLKHDSSCHGEGEFCLLCAVRSQIELSLTHSGRVISPSNLVDNLSCISSFFRRYQQEDAHEFLQCLLDKLDNNWSRYEANAKDSLSAEDSLVKQIFGGRLVSQVRCCKCGHNSNTSEPLIDLSLEIDNVDDLESALKSFTKVESIEDTEKFTCEGCKEQVPVEKQLLLDQVPSVAALHLKRFKSDGIYVEKIDKKVAYPLELDLKPYTKSADDGDVELRYELLGVVVHVGFSSTSGHYFCYVRTGPDAWYRFDDSKVTRVPEATALNQDAYILFYARKGTEWFGDFFEKWKATSGQKSPRTSPKSVLDDMELPSTSSHAWPGPEPGCGVQGERVTPPESPEPSRWIMPDTTTNHAVDALRSQHSPRANVTASGPMSSIGHLLHEDGKVDRHDSDAVRFSSPVRRVEQRPDVDPCTPPRCLSPDIYSDDEPAEAKCLIPVDHLKVADKMTASASAAGKKSSMDKAKSDVKRKEAARYMSKSMPSGRRHSLMAAMMGPHSDNSSLNKKRRKQAASASPKKRSKISPKHVLRPVVA